MMKNFSWLYKKFPFFLTSLLLLVARSSCRSDDPIVRTEYDIMGVWTNGEGRYMRLGDDTRAYNLYVTEQDGETIGWWEQDGYFYEPGYNILLYIDNRSILDVFQIVTLTESEMTICWVKEITVSDIMTGDKEVGQLIGEIIKEAQEGFQLDPALYQYFYRISEEEFLKIVDSLDLYYPWDY